MWSPRAGCVWSPRAGCVWSPEMAVCGAPEMAVCGAPEQAVCRAPEMAVCGVPEMAVCGASEQVVWFARCCRKRNDIEHGVWETRQRAVMAACARKRGGTSFASRAFVAPHWRQPPATRFGRAGDGEGLGRCRGLGNELRWEQVGELRSLSQGVSK